MLDNNHHDIRSLPSTTPLRCILLMGGHAAGKSTLFRWGRERINGTPGYTWHSEGGNGGRPSLSTLPVKDAHDLAWREWRDPAITTMVVEGTRSYSTVFKVARDHYDVGRVLWILQLLQTPDVGRAHMQARCAAKGKEYRADYWEREEAEYHFAERYEAALRKFWPRRTGPDTYETFSWSPPLGERLTIWVELGHTNLGPARTWFAKALGVPIVPRTPIHWEPPQESARIPRTPIRLPEEAAR